MLRDTPFPLYKYRGLSGPYGRIAVENAILNSRLFWQSPLSFNDPFDCNPVVYFGENDGERRRFLNMVATRKPLDGSRYIRRSHRRKLGNVKPQFMLRAKGPLGRGG
jgi:hypothetical protein